MTAYQCRRSGVVSHGTGPTVWCAGCARRHPLPKDYQPGPTPAPAPVCARCWTQPCACGADGYAYMVLHGGRPRQRWVPGVGRAMGKALALIHDTRRQQWPHPADMARGDVDPRAYLGSPANGVLGQEHKPMEETDP